MDRSKRPVPTVARAPAARWPGCARRRRILAGFRAPLRSGRSPRRAGPGCRARCRGCCAPAPTAAPAFSDARKATIASSVRSSSRKQAAEIVVAAAPVESSRAARRNSSIASSYCFAAASASARLRCDAADSGSSATAALELRDRLVGLAFAHQRDAEVVVDVGRAANRLQRDAKVLGRPRAACRRRSSALARL